METILCLLLLVAPPFLTYKAVFRRAVLKGGLKKEAALQATLASAAVNVVLALLCGLGLFVLARVIQDPAGYLKMVLVAGSMLTIFVLPFVSGFVGLFVGVVASIYDLNLSRRS